MRRNFKNAYVILTALVLAVGGVLFVNRKDNNLLNKAYAGECAYHVGYHYDAKEATIDESGWVEFWACCKCNHQFIGVEPSGSWTDSDYSHMIGSIDQYHIAYVAPLNEGGQDGEYWIKDNF